SDVLSGTWRRTAHTIRVGAHVAPRRARSPSRGGTVAWLRDAATWANVGAPGGASERDHRVARTRVHRLKLGAPLLRVLGGGERVILPVVPGGRHAADRAVLVHRLHHEPRGRSGLLDGALGARVGVGAEGGGALDPHRRRPRFRVEPHARRVRTYRLPFAHVARRRSEDSTSRKNTRRSARFGRGGLLPTPSL